MPLNPQITVLDAFEAVYHNLEGKKNAEPEKGSISLRGLKGYYDITPASVEVLAYLLHHHPENVPLSRLTKIAVYRKEGFMDILFNLKTRGFIKDNRHSCSLTEEAYVAFQNDDKFGVVVFKDCWRELTSSSERDIYYSTSWLNRFNNSLDLPTNASLKAACEKLHIKELPYETQKWFWLMVANFAKRFAEPFRCDDEIARSSDYLELQMGELAKHGLATVTTIEDDSRKYSEYVLSIDAARELFYGHDELIRYDEVAKYATVRKAKDIQKKELFFSDDAQEEISHLQTMLSEKGFERARQILIRQKRSPSIQSLLWGPPGTGKTETVKQLALQSGRDIIQFDMAKVTGYAWGATEKWYRALFRSYNYIAAVSKKTPILLLNEADSILSKRISRIERSIDKSENTVTNILLEELESLNGILMATTNNIDGLDEAFDRRFLFKTQLVKPDEGARFKIWKSSIPELTNEEAHALATTFEMSGAQIDNVVAKRDLAELYLEGERGLDYIASLCRKELSTENGSKSFRPRIGF